MSDADIPAPDTAPITVKRLPPETASVSGANSASEFAPPHSAASSVFASSVFASTGTAFASRISSVARIFPFRPSS